MAFWTKKRAVLLTPDNILPISNALAPVPHHVEWSIYNESMGAEQVLFIGEYAKIHICADTREPIGFASIMQSQTDPFDRSTNVVPLEFLLDFFGEDSRAYETVLGDKTRRMGLYGEIVSHYALGYFQNTESFTPLLEFFRGYQIAYNHFMSGRFG